MVYTLKPYPSWSVIKTGSADEEAPVGTLSTTDREIIGDLRAKGVLVDVGPEQFDDDGTVLVGCADGDQMVNMFNFHQEGYRRAGRKPRIHPLTKHGGALVLPDESPLNKVAERAQRFLGTKATAIQWQDEVLLWDISEGARLKKMRALALYAHAPCGAATDSGLSVRDEIALLVKAAERSSAYFPEWKIRIFFHVDYDGEEQKRTYHVPLASAKAWLAATC